MKKNLLWVMLMAVLTLGFTSCSKDDDNNDKPDPSIKEKLTGIWVQANEDEGVPYPSAIVFNFKEDGQLDATNITFKDYAFDDIITITGSWNLESKDLIAIVAGGESNKIKYKFDKETDILCLSDPKGKDPLYFMKVDKEELDLMLEYLPIVGAWKNKKSKEYVFYLNSGTCYQVDVDDNGEAKNAMTGEWDLDMDNNVIHEEWEDGLLKYDFQVEVTKSTLKQHEINDDREYEYEKADPVLVMNIINNYFNK